MKKIIILFSIFHIAIACKKHTSIKTPTQSKQLIHHAKGFDIEDRGNYYIMHIKSPWPQAQDSYQYILANNKNTIPDSLQNIPFIQIPISSIIATSTTHISSIVYLEKEQSLVAFPNLQYISSRKIRNLIQQNKIKEIADGGEINFEATIDISPDVVIAHSTQGNNPRYTQIQKAGIPVIYNGDWVEQTPLGKAEWIKFFGVLYDEYQKSETFFQKIEQQYNDVKQLAKNQNQIPTVMSGSIYQDIWYAPSGNSWMSQFIKDANAQYLWANTTGKGSLSLSYEEVLDKAEEANYWIGVGQYESYANMKKDNRHYAVFQSFKNKKIYSYTTKKGESGGIIFYEDAPNRPDIVLKDLVKILHPHLLPNYQPFYIQPLK